MSLERQWKSVSEGDPIIGKVKGTFRNHDCEGWVTEEIDRMDAYCIDNGVTRKQYLAIQKEGMKLYLNRLRANMMEAAFFGDDLEPS